MPAQLDYVAFYDKPLTKFERLLETYFAYAPSGFRSFAHGHAGVAQEEAVHAPRYPPGHCRDAIKAPLVFMDHHESHAASAFFPSPFDEAAILTLDGVGEWSTTTYGDRRGNKIRPDASAAISALAGSALLGVHVLLRLQREQRRIQADGPGAVWPARSTRTRSTSTSSTSSPTAVFG